MLATLGVLVAAVLALSTVTTAPSADAATVLGQFRNAAGRCLENLNNATTANNKIQINACGTATNQGQQFSRWATDEAIKTPAGRCLGTLNNATAAGTSVVLQALQPGPADPALGGAHRRAGGEPAGRALPRPAEQLGDERHAHGDRGLHHGDRDALERPGGLDADRPADDDHHASDDHHHDHHHDRPDDDDRPPRPPPRRRPRPGATRSASRSRRTRSGTCRSAAARCTGRRTCRRCPGGSTGARVPQVDDEPLVLTPTAPLTPILASPGGWGGNRCVTNPTTLATVPIPANYVLPSDNKNQSAAFLAADGRTVVQTQPLARCAAGGPATSYVRTADQDIYGPGVLGSHGGSGMSALGGSIRVGELRPGSQGPRHALKINLYAKGELAQCATRAECFRWPAVKPDSYAVGWYGSNGGNTEHRHAHGRAARDPPSVNIA